MTNTIDERHVIAIGEPGCYAHYGHVDGDAVRQVVLDLWEEDPEYLEPARHSYMTVTDCEGTHRPHDPHDEQFYKEVLPGTPNAHPFTIIAVVGQWTRPKG